MLTETNEHLSVSIFILSSGDVDALKKTFESILEQTYRSIELIIIEDSGDLNCINFVKYNIDFLGYLIVSSAFNRHELINEAVAKANGQYIYIIESGSVLHDKFVVEQMFDSVIDSDVLYGDYYKLFSAGKNPNKVEQLLDNISVDTLVEQMSLVFMTSFIKKKLYVEYEFNSLNLKFNVGWYFIFRIVAAAKTTFLHKSVVLLDVVVGRHGGIGRLSDINIARNERANLINQFYPELSPRLLFYLEPISINHKSSIMQYFIDNLKYNFRSLRSTVEFKIYKKKYSANCFNIPIIINNKNHLTYLLRLISSLEKRGYYNIYIIDNNSTYAPLLDFYERTNYKVFRLEENIGFCALWDTDIFDLFENQYYVYTDSDLELVDECPDDFMVLMHYLLNKYSLGKVGFSLPIDDLPEYFANRDEVKKWEAIFNHVKVDRYSYQAKVDTTFALYKPNTFGDAGMLLAFRTSYPYSARHLPWYENTKALNEEQRFYYKNAKSSTHWSQKINLE